MNTLDILKAIAPELCSGKTDDELNVFIALAAARTDPEVWGERLWKQGVAYLAAHMLSMSERGGVGGGVGTTGPVKQEMAGRVMISFGESSDDGAGGGMLGDTPYGREFLNLRKKLPGVRPFTTGFIPHEMKGR